MAVLTPVVLVALFALILNVLKRLATAEPPVDLNPASLEESFTGSGVWVGPYWLTGWTGPFTRLDVYKWGIRVGPINRFLAWTIPVTDMTWHEIDTVKLSRRSASFQCSSRRKGTVVFSSSWRGAAGLMFGKGPDPRLITALRRHGVLVQ
jgi:hypothetical protein